MFPSAAVAQPAKINSSFVSLSAAVGSSISVPAIAETLSIVPVPPLESKVIV